MERETRYKVNNYLGKYSKKGIGSHDLKGLWMSYSHNLPRHDIQPLADRPSERECREAFESFLGNLIEAGILEEIQVRSRRKR